MTLNEILKYPIKLILQGKVRRYKKKLFELQNVCGVHIMKNRRSGMTDMFNNFYIRNVLLRIKYEDFIKRWEIK